MKSDPVNVKLLQFMECVNDVTDLIDGKNSGLDEHQNVQLLNGIKRIRAAVEHSEMRTDVAEHIKAKEYDEVVEKLMTTMDLVEVKEETRGQSLMEVLKVKEEKTSDEVEEQTRTKRMKYEITSLEREKNAQRKNFDLVSALNNKDTLIDDLYKRLSFMTNRANEHVTKERQRILQIVEERNQKIVALKSHVRSQAVVPFQIRDPPKEQSFWSAWGKKSCLAVLNGKPIYFPLTAYFYDILIEQKCRDPLLDETITMSYVRKGGRNLYFFLELRDLQGMIVLRNRIDSSAGQTRIVVDHETCKIGLLTNKGDKGDDDMIFVHPSCVLKNEASWTVQTPSFDALVLLETYICLAKQLETLELVKKL